VQDVRQRLLAGLAQDEADVGARRAEQLGDGVGNRAVVASGVQAAQQPQRLADRGERWRQLVGNTERMEMLVMMAIREQRLVVDREQRAAQRREDRQLVVGPFDRRQRGANRLDLLAPRARRRSRASRLRRSA